MIKSGASFFYKGTRYVIGDILSINGRYYIAAAAYIFHETGNSIQVQRLKIVLLFSWKDEPTHSFDLRRQ
jgi:hypothetical protein